MADNKVNFLRGTSAEYESKTKDNDTFYYTTDDEKLYLGNKEITGGGITIDDTLSDTSENPVQNKVINAALNSKADLSDIPTTLPANGGNADTLDGLHANEIANNPNLLINPDFKINQRGLTEYKGHSGYTVDMWKTANEETEVTLTDNGLKVKRSIPISRAQVYQNIENFADFCGKTCTISANISELTAIAANLMVVFTSPGNMNHIVKDITSIGTISETFQVPNDITAMSIYLTGENGIEEADLNNYTIFQWVKLELGSIATPFCPPNHATELLKIQAMDGTIPADTVDGKHASDFALKTDIPTTLPADGGNADTVDGKHASDFVQNLTLWESVSVKEQLLKTTQSGFVWINRTCTDLPDGTNTWWYGIVIHTVSHYQLIITDISNVATYVLSYNAGTTPPRFYDWRNLSDGGNAATVNGLTVQTAVPANAKFTDTTYGAASTSANGLMTTGAQTLAGNKTFNGQVIPAGASAVDTAQARKIYAGTSDMTAGTTALETGAIYLVYE